ncbi:MAG TPA: hypothetical protein VNN17_03020 [Terriglobia bacterium]|nr:hypothetical protein [Terriglobia bacterium]
MELRHQYEERKDEQGLERALLTLVATVGEAADGGGIPGGLLAYLTFQVADKAGPANITLHTTAEATEQGSGRPLPEVEVVSELVEILAAGSEPLVSCFFFTH